MASIEDNGINHRKVQVMSSSNKPCETNRLFFKKKKKKKCHYMNRRRDAHGFQEINKPKKSCGAYNSSFGCWLFFFIQQILIIYLTPSVLVAAEETTVNEWLATS